MTRIVAPKHYSRRTNRHVKAAKPIWMRCVKKPRACARCDWLATPQTTRAAADPLRGRVSTVEDKKKTAKPRIRFDAPEHHSFRSRRGAVLCLKQWRNICG